MSTAITRFHSPASGDANDTGAVALTASIGTTPAIPWEGVSGGAIMIPTGSNITSLTFHAAVKQGGVFHPAADESGTAITMTVSADHIYALPPKLFGFGALKIVGDVAGTVYISRKG